MNSDLDEYQPFFEGFDLSNDMTAQCVRELLAWIREGITAAIDEAYGSSPEQLAQSSPRENSSLSSDRMLRSRAKISLTEQYEQAAASIVAKEEH